VAPSVAPKPTGALVLVVIVVTARTVQGMARVRSGQARPGLWSLAGVSAEAPGSSVTLRVRSPSTFACAPCPAATVTLEAGGADTDTQRAIPGLKPDLALRKTSAALVTER
jgi:hypothetical protein